MNPKLQIVTSHPIQYQVPWFKALHEDPRVDLEVLYLALPDAAEQGVGFGRAFEWDVPLREGYRWRKAESASGGIGKGYFGLRVGHARADILRSAPDAILVTGWQHYGMLQCLRAAARSRKPVLVRAESNGLKPMGGLRKLKALWGLSGIRRVLPIGRANRRFYEAIGLRHLLGNTVPYFVDNTFFADGAARMADQRSGLRRKWGIPQQAVCFLFAGKLIDKKHPQDALAALKQVARSQAEPAVHLLMVGAGEMEAMLRQRVASESLPVSFSGFLNQSEMPAAYAAADCLLLPSDFGETWGLVVNEAMACGLPAIVSDRVGCGPDLILEGETGFRHVFGDAESLAAAMRRFLALNADERACMGGQARRHVSSGYSVELAADRTVEAVLKECAG